MTNNIVSKKHGTVKFQVVRFALKTACTAAGLFAFIALANWKIPVFIGSLIVLNALLGLYFKAGE